MSCNDGTEYHYGQMPQRCQCHKWVLGSSEGFVSIWSGLELKLLNMKVLFLSGGFIREWRRRNWNPLTIQIEYDDVLRRSKSVPGIFPISHLSSITSPPSFPAQSEIYLSFFAELNLSNNRISALPSELTNCSQLEKIDISANSFVQLPACLTDLPQLKSLNASKNFVAEVEIEAVVGSGLETLNLEGNPLSKSCYDEMSRLTTVRVLLSPREQEDWEDLSI